MNGISQITYWVLWAGVYDFALCLFVLLVNDWLITKNIFTSARVPEYGLPVASSFVLAWTLVAS